MAIYTQMSGEEVAKRGKAWYAKSICAKVESPENIGKMVIINVKTGEYEVENHSLSASHHLHANRPDAPLYGIRIGYNFAETLGGVMERTSS